jgi:nucleotide-binding universal stress UspA family protein
MTYKAIMVVADATESCERRVQLAARLAQDFGAILLGAAAEAISANFYGAIGEASYLSGSMIDGQHELLLRDLTSAAQHFHSATTGSGKMAEWLSGEGAPLPIINDQACRADLVVAGRRSGDRYDMLRGAGAADLLLSSGRPVLVVPPELRQVDASTVMIAWKDTPQARRAVSDALPFLKKAQRVILACADEGPHGISDVGSVGRITAYLALHGVTITSEGLGAGDGGVGERLLRAAQRLGAGLIVAGAYGHARAQEWALGGVTQHLIRRSPIASFMSH